MFSKKKRKKRQVRADPATKKLVEKGVMSLPHDEGIYRAHKKHRKPLFSFWGGVRYVTFLSVLLWWLPTLGQMIAGYIGGRKTASPWKGILAACIPVTIIFTFSFLAANGILTQEIHFMASLPAMGANGLAEAVPVLEPYIHFAMEYLAAFVAALGATFSVGLNGYLVTIIFAYIGGIVGQQVKRELELRASPIVAMPQPPVSMTERIASDSMKKSKTWWGKRPEKLKEMRRIPVRTVAKKKSTKAPARAKAKPKPKAKPTKQASKAKTPQRDLGKKGYDKGTVNKRLIERALGRYQRR
ncbi:MAG: hypothetical protein JSV43_01280 [Methanobacteriota archaeon]|nr:MAG: hypothetical protein JSV43_01280 [Euryarchaeota archaeon]